MNRLGGRRYAGKVYPDPWRIREYATLEFIVMDHGSVDNAMRKRSR